MKLLSMLVFLLAAQTAFAEGAGRFLSVVGDVRITDADGRTRAAERNSELREGDTIITGGNALAQLRMADGAQMSVRPDTEMKLERFSYAGAEDRQPSFLASIVKGGLRVITGLIARQNRSGYAIRTASATMGVRGTHFELVHVVQPHAELLAGTYNRVYEGVTSIENRAGNVLLVNRDQTAFISLPGNVAPQIIVTPPALFGRPTPVPGVVMQPREGQKGEVARPGVRDATTVTAPRTIQPTPIDTRIIQTTPVLTAPVTTTISPTLTAPKIDTSTTLTAPTTTTTTTIRTDTILTSPTTTTIQTAPLTTTIQTAPLTAPLQTAPATTIQTAPLLNTAPITTTPTIK